ncbi:DUF4097 family beta strand repeat-containing protein [Marinilabilia sp.]|uniref:DUF4097 family beta strand repeat-containing protein n=1 Tax=Marinilabilia sp. TaxID=2021252 RepID=UPI0025C3802B|nr:DUF4097 family beta strand repeat-containing protein [Marinilabilia sp.]
MRKILFIFLIIIPSIASKGQLVINKNLEWSDGKEVQIDLAILDSAKIETWNENYIALEIFVDINNNKNNDWYHLETNDSRNLILVKSSFAKKKNFNADIFANIKLPKNCPLTFETIHGNIQLTGHEAPFSINTISGFIDITLNAEESFNFHIESIAGKVYTDLPLEQEKTDTPLVGTDMEASINGGKKAVNLKTISGNIYIRKEI